MTEREKYIAMLNASKQMMADTLEETHVIKSVNPNRDIASKSEFDEIN